MALFLPSIMVKDSSKHLDHKWSYEHFYCTQGDRIVFQKYEVVNACEEKLKQEWQNLCTTLMHASMCVCL